MLHLGHQRSPLRLGGHRGEGLGRSPSPLHEVQIQLQGGVRVQPEQFARTLQMAVLRRGRVVLEQIAQQAQSIAQGLARIGRLAVGPQQSRQLGARVQAPFDRQIEQQGLRLAQGKAEAAAVMNHFGRAEHVHP